MQLICDKNNLQLRVIKNFIYNKEFVVVKSSYKMDKKLLNKDVTIDLLSRLLYDPKYRLQWDNALKTFEVNPNENKDSSMNRYVIASPVFFISDREFIDKRVMFTHNNTHYCFSSSVDVEDKDSGSKLVRAVNLINAFSMSIDEEYCYFTGYNQLDIKIPLPDFLLNITIPLSTEKWFDNYIKMINSIDSNEVCKENSN